MESDSIKFKKVFAQMYEGFCHGCTDVFRVRLQLVPGIVFCHGCTDEERCGGIGYGVRGIGYGGKGSLCCQRARGSYPLAEPQGRSFENHGVIFRVRLQLVPESVEMQ